MTKPLVTTLIAAIGALAFANTARAQEESLPHKVGLIEMARVFKEYKKFESMSEALREEVKATTAQAQRLQNDKLKAIEEIKELQKGSPKAIDLEKQVLKIDAQLQLLRNETQRDLARKEAAIYRDVYKEVEEAVGKYATYYKYTLIIRYSNETFEEGEHPQMTIQKLNKLVLFHRPEDDITRSVIAYLNKKFQPAGN